MRHTLEELATTVGAAVGAAIALRLFRWAYARYNRPSDAEWSRFINCHMEEWGEE